MKRMDEGRNPRNYYEYRPRWRKKFWNIWKTWRDNIKTLMKKRDENLDGIGEFIRHFENGVK